jgi:hypothetical protein
MRRLLLMMSMAAVAIPAMAAAQPGCVPSAAQGGTAATTIPCSGYYDGDGVYRQGGGHYDADGAWHGANGHYDADGGWVATPAVNTPATSATTPQSAADFGVEAAYVGGAPHDVAGREQWLEALIRRGEAGGALRHIDAGHDLGRLESIRGVEARYSERHGGLTDQDRSDVGARLDDLGASVTAQWRPRN